MHRHVYRHFDRHVFRRVHRYDDFVNVDDVDEREFTQPLVMRRRAATLPSRYRDDDDDSKPVSEQRTDGPSSAASSLLDLLSHAAGQASSDEAVSDDGNPPHPDDDTTHRAYGQQPGRAEKAADDKFRGRISFAERDFGPLPSKPSPRERQRDSLGSTMAHRHNRNGNSIGPSSWGQLSWQNGEARSHSALPIRSEPIAHNMFAPAHSSSHQPLSPLHQPSFLRRDDNSMYSDSNWSRHLPMGDNLLSIDAPRLSSTLRHITDPPHELLSMSARRFSEPIERFQPRTLDCFRPRMTDLFQRKPADPDDHSTADTKPVPHSTADTNKPVPRNTDDSGEAAAADHGDEDHGDEDVRCEQGTDGVDRGSPDDAGDVERMEEDKKMGDGSSDSAESALYDEHSTEPRSTEGKVGASDKGNLMSMARALRSRV